MQEFTKSPSCKLRVHCVACRHDSEWRQSLFDQGRVKEVNFTCPNGVTLDTAQSEQEKATQRPAPILKLAASWKELHQRALTFTGDDDRKWLVGDFSVRIKSNGCSCRSDWKKLINTNLPRYNDYFAWSVEVHNSVNEKLGKPTLTVDQAKVIWAIDKPA